MHMGANYFRTKDAFCSGHQGLRCRIDLICTPPSGAFFRKQNQPLQHFDRRRKSIDLFIHLENQHGKREEEGKSLLDTTTIDYYGPQGNFPYFRQYWSRRDTIIFCYNIHISNSEPSGDFLSRNWSFHVSVKRVNEWLSPEFLLLLSIVQQKPLESNLDIFAELSSFFFCSAPLQKNMRLLIILYYLLLYVYQIVPRWQEYQIKKLYFYFPHKWPTQGKYSESGSQRHLRHRQSIFFIQHKPF